MRRTMLVAAAVVGLGFLAEAAVPCGTRGGAVKICEACRKKETPVDLAQFDPPDRVGARFVAGSACPGNDPDDLMVDQERR